MVSFSYAAIALIGMLILTAWGIASAVYGSRYKQEPLGVKRYCRQMTLYWGVINTIIGIFAVVTVLRSYDLYVSDVATQMGAQELFRFNALLDVGYIVVGSAVAYLGRKVSDQRRGFGLAIIVQGTFLLILDATLSLF